jgi:hexosaminidase
MFLGLQVPPTPPAVIPKPVAMVMDDGAYHLNANTRIAYSGQTYEDAKLLQTYLRPATGYELPLSRRGGSNAINLRIDGHLTQLGPEGYQLEVKPDRVEIWAPTSAGVFYGMETLRQIFPAEILSPSAVANKDWVAPCLHMYDYPRFAWRGCHMDVSRHFETKGYVEKFLDEMAFHKLNTFHWHLTDEPGWRIEIKQYPLLTEKSSGGDYSTMEPGSATISKSDPTGGFYTQDEIREVVAYAKERHITIVPEIEMPGHSRAAIEAYPELGNKIEIEAADGDTKGLEHETVYNVDDSTIQFLQNVLTEVMDLFPGPFIHIGGDEVDKRAWKANPKAQARMKELGLKDEEQLQAWFVGQMDTFIHQHSRRLIGWDEIMEGGLVPDAAVMAWRGTDYAVTGAKAGHDVVVAVGDLYFDHSQSKDPKDDFPAFGGYLPIQNVYRFNPMPPGLDPSLNKHILGAQAQLWSEFIPDARHMDYMAYPRLCALSEVLWSPPDGRSYPEFLTRLLPHLERLKIQDISFRPLRPADLQPVAP